MEIPEKKASDVYGLFNTSKIPNVSLQKHQNGIGRKERRECDYSLPTSNRQFVLNLQKHHSDSAVTTEKKPSYYQQKRLPKVSIESVFNNSFSADEGKIPHNNNNNNNAPVKTSSDDDDDDDEDEDQTTSVDSETSSCKKTRKKKDKKRLKKAEKKKLKKLHKKEKKKSSKKRRKSKSKNEVAKEAKNTKLRVPSSPKSTTSSMAVHITDNERDDSSLSKYFQKTEVVEETKRRNSIPMVDLDKLTLRDIQKWIGNRSQKAQASSPSFLDWNGRSRGDKLEIEGIPVFTETKKMETPCEKIDNFGSNVVVLKRNIELVQSLIQKNKSQNILSESSVLNSLLQNMNLVSTKIEGTKTNLQTCLREANEELVKERTYIDEANSIIALCQKMIFQYKQNIHTLLSKTKQINSDLHELDCLMPQCKSLQSLILQEQIKNNKQRYDKVQQQKMYNKMILSYKNDEESKKKNKKSKKNKNTTPPDNHDLRAKKMIPEEFFCPIGYNLMKDPVSTADGHIYDRINIESWLQHNDTSPITGQKLANQHLAPIHILRAQICSFLDKHPELDCQ